jgi:hypothetical protein
LWLEIAALSDLIAILAPEIVPFNCMQRPEACHPLLRNVPEEPLAIAAGANVMHHTIWKNEKGLVIIADLSILQTFFYPRHMISAVAI